jgi:tRNA(adenine34) deaminase
MSAAEAWNGLDDAWRAAFDEAWESWRSGCFGIGAVATRDDAIVARGRNRILEPKAIPGTLADTTIAHAEMNVLASLSWGQSDIVLTTTLEPCLMCASTIVQAGVREVRFAGTDPLFHDVTAAIDQLAFAKRHDPVERQGPIDGGLGRFGALLPLTFQAFWFPDSPVLDANAESDPDLVEFARELTASGALVAIKDDGGSTLDVLETLWSRLHL